MDFLVQMSGEVEGVIRKVLPELRIAVKRRQHIKEGEATNKRRRQQTQEKRQHIKEGEAT